jgi:isopentenyl diphosphate isomerase/L-lactate dehydrogenase-like FMN-dependent dehydrogenase
VAKALELLREELSVAMALCGLTDATKVPRSVILRGLPRPEQPDRCGATRVDEP